MISLYHFQKAVLQFIPPNPPLKGGDNKLVCSANYSPMVLKQKAHQQRTNTG